MAWLIDNAHIWFVLIGMALLAFGAAWWLQRKPKYLVGAAAAFGLIALLWLLTRVIVTDRQQLELNVHAMADAVAEGKSDVLLKHLAADFEFQGHKRQALADSVTHAAKQYKVYDIHISGFDVEELTATKAKVYFRATARMRADDRPYMVGCRGTFVRESGEWKLREVRFYNPVVNHGEEINLPIP